jgi:Fic family protein
MTPNQREILKVMLAEPEEYLSAQEIAAITGRSSTTVNKAIGILRSEDLIETKYTGIPKRLRARIKTERITQAREKLN